MFKQYDDILTVDQVREILFIGKNTAYRLLNSGALKAFRIGRTWQIPLASLEEFAKKCYK